MSRRSVLVASVALPLAACGVRLESGAPAVLGTPSPDPAGPALLAERARVAEVLAAAGRPSSGPLARLVPLHTRQLAALDAALGTLDPPVQPEPVTPATTPTTGGSGTNAGAASPAQIARLESAALDRAGLAALDTVLPRVAAVVVASHAQRAVALHLLRAARVRGVPTVPVAPWIVADRDVGLRLVQGLRSAAYALEVVAARTDPARRGPLLAALQRLRGCEEGIDSTLTDLPPRPLGHPLPHAASGAALIEGVLDRLLAVVVQSATTTALVLRDGPRAAASAPTTPGVRPSSSPSAASPATAGRNGAMAALVRLATIVEADRIALGGAVRPLPGLRPDAASGAQVPVVTVTTATG